MLLICPVRPGDANEELRHAIRSWETNLILPGGLDLMTVGHRPSWLHPDHHVSGNRYQSVMHAVLDNVVLGSEAALGQGQVVFMNDDFFCLDPVGAILPVRRNCTLDEHIAMFPANSSMWWPRSLRHTAGWLAERGHQTPWSFEVHRPLIASPQGMLQAVGDVPIEGTVPQWRTAYGVLTGVHAHPVKDAKLGLKNLGVGTPWVSTSDESWRRYATTITKRFQKPSRWER